MKLQLELQLNPVADEVAAITAVVRPIITGTLYALKRDIVSQMGGHENITLEVLSRLYRRGDGDCGLCFEYAVHDAMNRGEQTVLERLVDAMQRHCHIRGEAPGSILFGAEKAGSLSLIDTAQERLTTESRLLAGTRGQPVKLKKHIDSIAAAFRRREMREKLPWSIAGVWKADLFVGHSDVDRWVATSVKINPNQLEAAQGLRIGIVPSREGRHDNIVRDEQRNLVICPLPHDGAFMETFYKGWGVVQQFFDADATVPREVNLPRPPERQVARYLADRRTYPVLEVVDALRPLAQPELLQTDARDANILQRHIGNSVTGTVVAPIAKSL